MLKNGAESSSNETKDFEGLSIDILEEISKRLEFNYEIYQAPDGKFGVKNRLTRKWNGIVKEIRDKVLSFLHYCQ